MRTKMKKENIALECNERGMEEKEGEEVSEARQLVLVMYRKQREFR